MRRGGARGGAGGAARGAHAGAGGGTSRAHNVQTDYVVADLAAPGSGRGDLYDEVRGGAIGWTRW